MDDRIAPLPVLTAHASRATVRTTPTRERVDGFDRGRGRRLAIGATLLAAALGADLLLQSVLAPPEVTTPAYLAWFSFQFLAVVASCVMVNAWSQRHGYGAAGRLVRAILAAGSTGLLLAAISTLVLSPPPPLPGHPGASIRLLVILGFVRGVIVCGLWALGFLYPLAVEAERSRVDAELARLRSHLEPHFILNTLNLIAGLTGQDPEEARRLIGCLGELLADAVEDGSADITVEGELAWLRRYADILEARHPGLVRFRFDLAAEARQRTLPRLLLQPLVENAAKHGVLGTAAGGLIVVQAAIDAATSDLVCVVADDGKGVLPRAPREGAFGLLSVRRRLALERPGATFELQCSGSGTRAVVRIPQRSGRR
jgi:hypothetical protein